MLEIETKQTKLSKKLMLSFEEFENQVLEVFNCDKEECKFWSESYAFFAEISYQNHQWLQFEVKYITNTKNRNYGRWFVIKTYRKSCKDISDSLIQGVRVLAQKTEESIKEEIAFLNLTTYET